MSKKSCEAAESAESAFCEWARLNVPSQASCAQAARPNAQFSDAQPSDAHSSDAQAERPSA